MDMDGYGQIPLTICGFSIELVGGQHDAPSSLVLVLEIVRMCRRSGSS